MEQGYFYTLSAIAQSFAAIIALNGIFVIFKLQALTNQRNELVLQLKTLLYKDMGGGSGFDADRKAAFEKIESYSEKDFLAWGENGKGQSSIVAEKSAIVSEIKKSAEMYNYVLKLLQLPLLVNGTVIAFSVLFLILKTLLKCIPSCIILAGGGILSLLALYLTVRSILMITTKGNVQLTFG